MKTTFTSFVISFFVVSVCMGQSSVAPVINLGQQLTLKQVTARVFVIPSIGFRMNNNTTLFAPVIRVAQLDHVLPDKPMLSGFQGTYRFLLGKKENRRLSLFGEFNSKYQVVEEEWTSNYWNAAKYVYVDYEVETEEEIWESSLGIGVGWSVFRNIGLNLSLGAGYYLSYLEYDDIDKVPDLKVKKDYRGYKDKGIFYSVQLGISYNLPGISDLLTKP